MDVYPHADLMDADTLATHLRTLHLFVPKDWPVEVDRLRSEHVLARVAVDHEHTKSFQHGVLHVPEDEEKFGGEGLPHGLLDALAGQGRALVARRDGPPVPAELAETLQKNLGLGLLGTWGFSPAPQYADAAGEITMTQYTPPAMAQLVLAMIPDGWAKVRGEWLHLTTVPGVPDSKRHRPAPPTDLLNDL